MALGNESKCVSKIAYQMCAICAGPELDQSMANAGPALCQHYARIGPTYRGHPWASVCLFPYQLHEFCNGNSHSLPYVGPMLEKLPTLNWHLPDLSILTVKTRKNQ